jgi:outer membrane protein OmpA-like peptidoglycan-associated protein
VSYALLSRKTEADAPATKTKKASTGLRISDPNDSFELEADRVADEVMAGGRPRWSLSRVNMGVPLQRKCSCAGGGECEDCKEKSGGTLQRRASGPTAPAVAPPIVHDVLRSPGQPLDSAMRAFFEPRFGHDFGHVRVHTDAPAAASATAVNAVAYTAAGSQIVFGAGAYAPATARGRDLIAHELAHVVQQGRHAGFGLQRQEGENLPEPERKEAKDPDNKTWEYKFRLKLPFNLHPDKGNICGDLGGEELCTTKKEYDALTKKHPDWPDFPERPEDCPKERRNPLFPSSCCKEGTWPQPHGPECLPLPPGSAAKPKPCGLGYHPGIKDDCVRDPPGVLDVTGVYGRAADPPGVLGRGFPRVYPVSPTNVSKPPAGTDSRFKTDLAELASPIMAAAIGSDMIDGFDTDKADISKTNREKLSVRAKIMQTLLMKYPGSTVRVIGHTDAVGREEHNQTLGQSRADSVRSALVEMGIPVGAIQTESKGETQLLIKTQKAESRNRRVEVKFEPRVPLAASIPLPPSTPSTVTPAPPSTGSETKEKLLR